MEMHTSLIRFISENTQNSNIVSNVSNETQTGDYSLWPILILLLLICMITLVYLYRKKRGVKNIIKSPFNILILLIVPVVFSVSLFLKNNCFADTINNSNIFSVTETVNATVDNEKLTWNEASISNNSDSGITLNKIETTALYNTDQKLHFKIICDDKNIYDDVLGQTKNNFSILIKPKETKKITYIFEDDINVAKTLINNDIFSANFYCDKITLDSIKITKKPTKLKYYVGDEFDKSGMSVTAYYNNNLSRELDFNEYDCSPQILDKPGDNVKISINYTESDVTKTDYLYVEVKEAHTHNLIHHDAKEATCTSDGNKEYWQCSVCHKYYMDTEAIKEVTWDEIVIKKHHTLELIKGLEPTTTDSGYKDAWRCSSCNEYFEDELASIKIGTKEEYNEWKNSGAGHLDPKQVEIMLDNDGGIGGQDSVKVVYGKQMPNLIDLPVKHDYNFDGYWDKSGTIQYYDGLGKGMCLSPFSKSDTIIAHWVFQEKLQIDFKSDENGAFYLQPDPGPSTKPITTTTCLKKSDITISNYDDTIKKIEIGKESFYACPKANYYCCEIKIDPEGKTLLKDTTITAKFEKIEEWDINFNDQSETIAQTTGKQYFQFDEPTINKEVDKHNHPIYSYEIISKSDENIVLRDKHVPIFILPEGLSEGQHTVRISVTANEDKTHKKITKQADINIITVNTESINHEYLNDYSWDELKDISDAISNNTLEEPMIGKFKQFAKQAQTKDIIINSEPNVDTLSVRIVGFKHDPIYGENDKKAGITFMAAHSLFIGRFSDYNFSYAKGWKNIYLRTSLNYNGVDQDNFKHVYNGFPQELKNILLKVEKSSQEGWINDKEFSPKIQITGDRIFIPSQVELGSTSGPQDEGEKYEYAQNDAFIGKWKPTSSWTTSQLMPLNHTGYIYLLNTDKHYNNANEAFYDTIQNHDGQVMAGSPFACWERSVWNDKDAIADRMVIQCDGSTDNDVTISSSACITPCFCIGTPSTCPLHNIVFKVDGPGAIYDKTDYDKHIVTQIEVPDNAKITVKKHETYPYVVTITINDETTYYCIPNSSEMKPAEISLGDGITEEGKVVNDSLITAKFEEPE